MFEAADLALSAIALRVRELDGRATLVRDSLLEAEASRLLEEQMRAARAEEYAAIQQDAAAFLEHVRRETDHRDFSLAELGELEADLRKLNRWYNQVRERDRLTGAGGGRVDSMLRSCQEALATCMNRAPDREPVS